MFSERRVRGHILDPIEHLPKKSLNVFLKASLHQSHPCFAGLENMHCFANIFINIFKHFDTFSLYKQKFAVYNFYPIVHNVHIILDRLRTLSLSTTSKHTTTYTCRLSKEGINQTAKTWLLWSSCRDT